MVPMHLGLIDGPFVPHNLISAQESPVPLPKFWMAQIEQYTCYKLWHWIILIPQHADKLCPLVDSSWNVIAQRDAWEEKWRGNWGMEWVASTLHTTSEHGVSSITTADAHCSAAGRRLNWHPSWFKWTWPFCWKTKSGFCACAITFQTQSTQSDSLNLGLHWSKGFRFWMLTEP